MITQERLKEIVDYHPDTGDFTWAKARPACRPGDSCGRTTIYGYREICVDGTLHHAHRLAVLWMTGRFPPESVDHINGVRDDNRWCNLRECNQSQNMANVGLRSTNTSGIAGVVWDKDRGKWRAQLRVDRKQKNLGRFDSREEAQRVVRAAAIAQWGEFVR